MVAMKMLANEKSLFINLKVYKKVGQTWAAHFNFEKTSRLQEAAKSPSKSWRSGNLIRYRDDGHKFHKPTRR